MIQDYDFKAEVTSEFKVRGNQVSATFDVLVPELEWTEDDAVAFTESVNDKHPDLYSYTLQFQELTGDGAMLMPTPVERLSFRWIGKLSGPEPREKVEAEFAARRQVVVALLNQWIIRPRTFG